MLLQFDCLLLEVEKAAQSVMSVCMERIVMFVYYTSVSTKAGVGDRSWQLTLAPQTRFSSWLPAGSSRMHSVGQYDVTVHESTGHDANI